MEVGKVIKRGEDPVFFFFFFLLFTFENDGNSFWVYQNGNFLPGKSISRREKKSGETTLPPQKNMPVTSLIDRTETYALYCQPQENSQATTERCG